MTFTWARTFPDSHHDFVAAVREGLVGRVQRAALHGLGVEVWAWSAFGVFPIPGDTKPLHGQTATRAEAIAALADVYHRAKAWGAKSGQPFIRSAPPERRPIVDELP